MKFQRINRLPEFERELKKLKKRYRTLDVDLDIVINTLLVSFHKLKIENEGVLRIDDLGDIRSPVYKVKKFACRSLKGKGVRTGLRLIYAYIEEEDCIELIEIYMKGDKSTENRDRIKKRYGVK